MVRLGPETPQRIGRRRHLTPSKTPISRTPKRTPIRQKPSLVESRLSSKRKLTFTESPGLATGTPRGDRYIPSRANTNTGVCRKALRAEHKSERWDTSERSGDETPKTTKDTPLHREFKRRMLSSMCNVSLDQLDENCQPKSILHGTGKSSSMSGIVRPFSLDTLRTSKLGGMESDVASQQIVANKMVRAVPSAPIRILDAPDIVDDYYLNLISWSKDNVLAVALNKSVYLWNAGTGDIQHLLTVEDANNYVTSVSWSTLPGQFHLLAVGLYSSEVQIFDTLKNHRIRILQSHQARVSALAWTGQTLTSGGRDSIIVNHDVRVSRPIVSTFRAHTQEVCGIKWNEEGSCLASGGNENYLCLWDAANSRQGRQRLSSRQLDDRSHYSPRIVLTDHKAAVKALDWCPFHRGLLASGGGTADRSIKFWNTSSGTLLNSVDTGSQVCAIVWSQHMRELCSSHGYSENQLVLWKFPTMTKVKELTGHTARVLNMDISPSGTSIVSAGADETLRFWSAFQENSQSTCRHDASGEPFFGQQTIR